MDFTENLEIEMPAAANISYDSDTKEAQYLYSLPERLTLRGLQANQDYKGSLQEDELVNQYPRTEKFGDLIIADHKVLPQRRM